MRLPTRKKAESRRRRGNGRGIAPPRCPAATWVSRLDAEHPEVFAREWDELDAEMRARAEVLR